MMNRGESVAGQGHSDFERIFKSEPVLISGREIKG